MLATVATLIEPRYSDERSSVRAASSAGLSPVMVPRLRLVVHAHRDRCTRGGKLQSPQERSESGAAKDQRAGLRAELAIRACPRMSTKPSPRPGVHTIRTSITNAKGEGMKVVILAGGYGTRISEESAVRPKPMSEIGGMPVLWHIMKIYSAYGLNDFVICCGYKGHIIKEWFARYQLSRSDVTFDFRTGRTAVHQNGVVPGRDLGGHGRGNDDRRTHQARRRVRRRRGVLLHVWRRRKRRKHPRAVGVP